MFNFYVFCRMFICLKLIYKGSIKKMKKSIMNIDRGGFCLILLISCFEIFGILLYY